jgi:hypothetical protein
MEIMENFFYEDNFCSDLEDLLSSVLQIDEGDIAADLPDDWEIKVDFAELQTVFKLSVDDIVENIMVENISDKYEERLTVDIVDEVDAAILSAIRENLDIDKINATLPRFWYPSGEIAVITKKDLLDYFL